MNREPRLLMLPMLKARPTDDGKVVITGKFLSGVEQYLRDWSGEIIVLMEPSHVVDNNLDHVEIHPDELPFKLRLVSFMNDDLLPYIRESDVVMASVGWTQNHVSKLCREANVPCVYVAEHSLLTRKQMIRAGTWNPLLRWRRTRWMLKQEKLHREAIALAEGIQCNGTPAFETYRELSPSPFLYFDSRVTRQMLADEATLKARTDDMLAGRPLHLVFSGRFTRIKGVDHLPRVAVELKKLNVPFEMALCGNGELLPIVRRNAAKLGVDHLIKFTGPLDFATQLVPFVAQNADLFVCCHRQGDPSCTYLETMSCGVPIAGYDNEALAGIVRESSVGWSTPMERPAELARRVADLNADRSVLASAAFEALRFASGHTFEDTFRKRVEHLHQIRLAARKENE